MKSSFKVLGFSFSAKLDLGFYFVSIITKTVFENVGTLIHFMKFLAFEVFVLSL